MPRRFTTFRTFRTFFALCLVYELSTILRYLTLAASHYYSFFIYLIFLWRVKCRGCNARARWRWKHVVFFFFVKALQFFMRFVGFCRNCLQCRSYQMTMTLTLFLLSHLVRYKKKTRVEEINLK